MKKIILFSFLFVVSIVNVWGQACPANNTCATAFSLSPNPTCITTTFNIAGCSDENATGDCGLSTTQNTIWFKFVASATTATITVVGASGKDYVIGARTACGSTTSPSGGTCTDATGNGGTETLNLSGLTIGSTYYINVYEYNGDTSGTGTICVIAPPANDTCGGATNLTVSSNSNCNPILGTTWGATDNNETGDCTTGTENAVWYKFVATATTHEVFVTGSTGFNPVVKVGSACASTTTPTGGACINSTGDGGKEVLFLSGLTVGVTYYVQVHDFNGDNTSSSTFNICVTTPTIPTCGTNPTPTDACASAPLINNLDSFCGTTSGFTADGTFTGCASGYTIENNSYFRFVAASTDVTLNFWLTGGGSCASGIQIALFSGTCGSLTSVACASNPTGGTGSSGVFNVSGLTVGTTYYVMIDGYAGDVCTYSLAAVSGVAAVCANCTQTACATNTVADDYYSLETESTITGNWNAYGATAATGTPYTANGTAQGPYTVCTDIMPTSSTFIGFDYLVNALGTTAAISEIKTEGTFTLIGVTQELSTGVCTALVPSGTNAFGMPEFNDTGGTPGVTAGAFDHTKPMTVCLSYALTTASTLGGTISGFTVMGYNCATPTSVTVGAQSACSGSTYSQTLTINFNPTNLPTPAVSGGTSNVSLTVNGQVFAITPAEQTAGSKTITLTGLNANGLPVNVSAFFTTSSACVLTVNSAFTAPSCICASPPSVSIVESSVTICGVTTFNYTVVNGPATLTTTGTGTLSTTSLPNGTSTFTYTPSVGDGGNTRTITATIADPDGAGGCTASSDVVTVIVNPVATVSIAPTTVYAGNRTFVATTNITSGTITYTFKKNGVTQQSSTSSAWSATGLLQSDVVTCEISVVGGACSAGATATSNSVTIQAPLQPNLCTAVVAAADQSVNCGASTTLQSTLRTIYAVTQTSCDAIVVSSPTTVTFGGNQDDQVTTDIPIGFNFDFFGTPYTNCRIHSNGIVSFGGQTYTGYTAVTIPNGATAPNNYIAGFYTDIHPGCGGSVTYKTIGTAPNRQFVVTYTDIEPYYDGACSAPSGDAVSFQIILEETTNLVRIIMISVPSTFVAGFSGSRVANATQGIEAGDGSIAFTTPGRNWQVWNNPGLTPAYRDCTTFGPVNYASTFVDWKVGAAQVSTSNPYTFNATANQTYTATWNINGAICTDDVVVSIANSPTMTLETATNVTNCTTPNGTIPLTFTNTANGTYTVSYQKDGVAQTASVTVASGSATLSSLGTGVYTNFSVNIGGCTATATGSRTIAITNPVITLGTATNSTSCSSPNGSIPLTFTSVADGPYTLNYTKDGVATSSSITVSSSGTQSATSTTTSTTNGTGYGSSMSITYPALPAGVTVTSVVTIITFTAHSPSLQSEVLVRATPPAAFGSAQTGLQPSTVASSGTTTNASFGSWGTGSPVGTWLFEFAESVNTSGVNPDANIASVTITVSYSFTSTATLSNLGAGTYTNFSLVNSVGCTATGSGSRVITAPNTPAATGVTICQGGAGNLTSSAVCTTTTSIAQGATFNTGTLDTSDSRWSKNSNGTTCDGSGTANEYYETFTFTVSTTGSYTFNMCTTGTNWDGHASLYQNAFNGSNPCGTASNFLQANDDGNSGGVCNNDPRITENLTAGTTYILVTTGFDSSELGGYGWTFSGPTSATLSVSTTSNIQWYTVASGGTSIGSGSSFDPVGKPNSGLVDTSISGTTVYYAACSSDPACRTAVNFTITAPITPTVSISPFNIFASTFPTSQTITATASNAGTAVLNYDFRKNGVSQQSSASATWNATGLQLNDVITCVLTVTSNNGACISGFTSATSNNATVRTTPLPSGVRGNTLTFNGTNQSVSVPDMSLLDMTSNYTIEVWAKFNSLATGNQAIISKNNGSNNGYYLGRNGSALVFDGLTTSSGVINATDWHHIAVVNDNGTRRLYVNGWEQALTGTAITVAANTQNIGIGFDANTNTYFNGQIDEVRIWSTVRSQFTLRENMHLVLAGTESNLVSYYQFNESAGATLTDIVSRNDGTLQNAPVRGISHANVGRGTSNTIAVNSAGLQTFTNSTNCKLNFSGNLPMGDIVVSRVEGLPAGVNLVTVNATIRSVYTRYYWVINNFGTTNTGLTVSPTFILGSGQISPAETLTGLKMDKRPTNKDITWTAYSAQAIVSTATGEATFADIDGFSEFVIHSEQASPLPSMQVSLTGERKDEENVQLKWFTNIEPNNKGFEVQTSEDKQNFTTIGFADAKGNINVGSQYDFLVTNPHDAYYRLKQVSQDGSFSYSAIIFIEGIQGDLVVFPNPTKGELNLRLGKVNRATEKLKLSLYDITGKLVFENEGVWANTELKLQNFLMNLRSSGTYLLQATTRQKIYKRKIEVVK